MIRDARALQPGWTPNDLVHRHGDTQHLSSCLQPIENDFPGEDVLITGPSGAGKTTLARYVTTQLQRETLGVQVGEVSCMSDSSQHGALHALVRDLGLGLDLARDGTATSTYLDRLRDADDQLVLILDEIVSLAEPELVGSLHHIPHVTTIMICVDETDLRADVDARIDDRLRAAASVHLDAYSTSELVDIIEARADHGLTRSLGSATAEHMASHASGSARQAIAILRQAAMQAQQSDVGLSPGLVDDVVDDAEVDIRDRNISQLSSHHRLLLDIVKEHGEIAAGDLHGLYEKRVSTPKSKTTRRRYLNALRRYDLVKATGSTRGRQYQICSVGGL